jgi:hypothetical protein
MITAKLMDLQKQRDVNTCGPAALANVKVWAGHAESFDREYDYFCEKYNFKHKPKTQGMWDTDISKELRINFSYVKQEEHANPITTLLHLMSGKAVVAIFASGKICHATMFFRDGFRIKCANFSEHCEPVRHFSIVDLLKLFFKSSRVMTWSIKR